jgi:predicted SprT family Zn-dependent metalloprotease
MLQRPSSAPGEGRFFEPDPMSEEQFSLFSRLKKIVAPPASPRAAPRERSGAEVLALVRAGGLQAREVVFTRNRRIMASLAGGGATIRLHRSFAAAPEAVLGAVGRLFSSRSTRERNAARRVVRDFLAAVPKSSPVRHTRRVPATDRAHLERLGAEFDRVNREYFADALPKVSLYLSGRMRSRNGHFSSSPLEIVISRRLCNDAAAGEAEQTLRHEMIHLWQHAVGRKPDHGAEFRAWARRLGVHPRARRPVNWKEEE